MAASTKASTKSTPDPEPEPDGPEPEPETPAPGGMSWVDFTNRDRSAE